MLFNLSVPFFTVGHRFKMDNGTTKESQIFGKPTQFDYQRSSFIDFGYSGL